MKMMPVQFAIVFCEGRPVADPVLADCGQCVGLGVVICKTWGQVLLAFMIPYYNKSIACEGAGRALPPPSWSRLWNEK